MSIWGKDLYGKPLPVDPPAPKSVFDTAMEFVFEWEGGYDNDPDDPGGETKYGIDKRSHPGVDIKNLTKDQAKDIYFEKYWLKAQCDKLYPILAVTLFNYSVNMGIGQAAKFLQRAIGVVADGRIGPKTLNAVKDKNPESVAIDMIDQGEGFYRSLAKNKPVLRKYLKGWLNRNNALEEFIKGFIKES
jgi:lysozyme family protein